MALERRRKNREDLIANYIADCLKANGEGKVLTEPLSKLLYSYDDFTIAKQKQDANDIVKDVVNKAGLTAIY